MNVKTKIALFIALAAVIIIAAFFVLKKQEVVTPQTPAIPQQDTLQNMPAAAEEPETIRANAYELYSVNPVELFDKIKLMFVSVSDRYAFNEHPDSLNIPEKTFRGKKAGDAPHIPLQGVYRNRLLAGIGAKESDSLFVYNYAKDVLQSYLIHDLKTSAVINAYSSENEYAEQHYYQLGFELPLSVFAVSEDYDNLVYIGTKNIFTRGQVNSIHWIHTDSKNFPAHSCKHQAEIKKLKFKNGNVFEYTQDGYHYYVQDGYKGNEPEGYNLISVRHLLILDGNKNVVTDLFLESSEGSSVAPLNRFSNNTDENVVPQYSGKLFKDKPPIILGLEWASFGCESIEFLSRDEQAISINCDNRH